jgi:thymidylate synthase (FAD)
MRIEIFDDALGAVESVDHMGSDLTVVNAARVSFAVQKEELDYKDKKLIKYLLEHNHTSPFEHCSLTMRFTVPLFIRSQHHRHRTWAYNEVSRRYTDEDIRFYQPRNYRTQHKSNRQASNQELVNPTLSGLIYGYETASESVAAAHTHSLALYRSMLSSGICREQARGVLPQNLYTQYYGTVNLHNLYKFIQLRTHEGAQWEIQQVAKACLKIANEHFPICTELYKEIKGMT